MLMEALLCHGQLLYLEKHSRIHIFTYLSQPTQPMSALPGAV